MATHHFICTYFNGHNYSIRRRLTQEFCDRYPNIHLIQVAYGDQPFEIESKNTTRIRIQKFEGFVIWKLVNEYLRANPDVKSLTLVDSDLILEPLFFVKVGELQDSNITEPTVIHGFRDSYELIKGQLHKGPRSMVANGNGKGHTGFILSFNKAFLNSYKFPESFVLGGFDYYLITCLVNKKCIISQLEHLPLPCGKLIHLETDIIHCCHGKKTDRLTPWKLYPNPTEQQVDEYFKRRSEC